MGFCSNYNNIKWLSLIEETKWLEYVTSILTAARDVIESFGVTSKNLRVFSNDFLLRKESQS